LYFHERILADAACNPEFRVPVWDWDADPEIPEFYHHLGLPSFLKLPYRQPDPRKDVVKGMFSAGSLRSWLLSSSFESFCGTCQPKSNLLCNSGPHSAVHLDVVKGAMAPSRTSAADPIFYSHHANVDRFFRYWLNRYNTFNKPDGWLKRNFCLCDERGRWVRVQTRQILYEGDLGYTYGKDPSVCLYDFADICAEATDLRAVLSELLVGIELIDRPRSDAEIRDFVESLRSGGTTVQPLSVRISVELKPEAVRAGVYYRVLVSNGNDTAPLGGFGFFGHELHAPAEHGNVDALITGVIDSTVLKVLRTNANLALVYMSTEVGGSQNTQFSIPFDANLVFHILAPSGAYDAGKRKVDDLQIKL
jgi:hypothetical protein